MSAKRNRARASARQHAATNTPKRPPVFSRRVVTVIGLLAVVAVGIVLARASSGGDDAIPFTHTSTASKKLLFFMNPDGYPCQTQKAILDAMGDTLSKVADVVYYKTTKPSDLQKFEEFGIRGLPSLIVADKDGRPLRRLTPGVQSAQDVLAALTQ